MGIKKAFNRIVAISAISATFMAYQDARADEAVLECLNCNLDATQTEMFNNTLGTLLSARGISPETSTVQFRLEEVTYLANPAVSMKFMAVTEVGTYFTGYSTQYTNLADDKIDMAIKAVIHAMK